MLMPQAKKYLQANNIKMAHLIGLRVEKALHCTTTDQITSPVFAPEGGVDMGCCASTQSGSSYPPQNANNHSSTRAFTTSQPQSNPHLPRPSTNTSSQSTNHRGSRSNQSPLAQHINLPLKPHVWRSRNRTWTRQQLDRERAVFFDTRTAGRTEIWQTLRAALEILWAGGEPEDHDGGVGTAQQILDAADITIPTGDLAVGGAFDAFGVHYKMPPEIVSDPENIVASPEVSGQDDEADKSVESEELDEDEILRRREEKGKAVINTKDLIHVKARLSDGQIPDLVVSVGKDDSVRFIARRIFEEAQLAPPTRLKIAYMGKVLKENQSLTAQGWNPEHMNLGIEADVKMETRAVFGQTEEQLGSLFKT
ncbi:hypothetical protein G7Y89_g4300 [Cudoniella acicularis]|uniref:Ubiquitin-like domain-containing protein n=1 Tax=Cudoniella acicularis TaxID=354080 RepID=A0A8H4W4U4_9HELO|nr:hypothetical protein G7Y89_g4300 [Cudoniella acicularis]